MSISIYTLAVNTSMPDETNLLSIAAKGGFLMIVLLLISLVAITIIIERLIKLRKSQKIEDEFLQEIYGHLGNKNTEKAIQICEEKKDNPIANVFAKAIESLDNNITEIKEIIETSIKKEIHQFEKNLGTLATFAAIAPLIGFLGTVTGMVKVFMKISGTGGGVDITLLANGIWEALITTIGGLTVGIITILFYNYLVGKVESLAQELEENSHEFIFNIRRIKNED